MVGPLKAGTDRPRVLIRTSARTRLALVVPIVIALGHEVIAHESEVEDVGAVTARERPRDEPPPRPRRPVSMLAGSLLAPFSALGESKGGRCLLGPGWCDLEEFEDAALCVGEAVELDAGVCVGEAESLEDAEDVTSGGFR